MIFVLLISIRRRSRDINSRLNVTIMRRGGRSDALQVTFILTEEEEEGAEGEDKGEDEEEDPFNIGMTHRL